MADFVLSERARRDLINIGDYTAEKWSVQQAERYIRTLIAECRLLSDHPLAGRSYDRCRTGLRGYPCGKHIIFYRVLSRSRVRIVRILHERMDFPAHL